MLIRRPPFTVFDTFRCQMLTAFGQWVSECKPTPVEAEAEIAATISAMRQQRQVEKQPKRRPGTS
jgi:hypothetical protein